MSKKSLFIFILSIICVSIYIESAYGVSELAIEKITRQTPEAKIEDYIKAVAAGDSEGAYAEWDIPQMDDSSVLSEDYYKGLEIQKKEMTQYLIDKKINSEFKIRKIEWWSTCCGPHAIENSRAAGRAKFYVDLTDSGGSVSSYVFDLSVPGGYDGGLTSHYVRHWNIDSISLED
ncbi:MAG: hypothetical protein PHI66_04925 [Candidatus Pacebacteria bacterium]|nr:hypothetical protein [Candidatus Paceibacterota bacterium]